MAIGDVQRSEVAQAKDGCRNRIGMATKEEKWELKSS